MSAELSAEILARSGSDWTVTVSRAGDEGAVGQLVHSMPLAPRPPTPTMVLMAKPKLLNVGLPSRPFPTRRPPRGPAPEPISLPRSMAFVVDAPSALDVVVAWQEPVALTATLLGPDQRPCLEIAGGSPLRLHLSLNNDLLKKGDDGWVLVVKGDTPTVNGAITHSLPERPLDGAEGREYPQEYAIQIFFPQADHPEVYPDRPRAGHSAWNPVNSGAGAPLLYKQSDRPDEFLYLPTAYKLGFYQAPETPDAPSPAVPPFHAKFYRPDGPSSNERITVTLCALPWISVEDRERLRDHVQANVLSNTVPFVRLVAASGLVASFHTDFQGASADNAWQSLPEGIQFREVDIAAERRLLFMFDMPFDAYPIFCELLRRGLRGTVELRANDLKQSVPVLLRLDDLTSNALKVRLVSGDGDATLLQLGNLLSSPVLLPSLKTFLLDRGASQGLVFEAEEREFIESAGTTLKDNETASFAVDLSNPTRTWSDLVFAVASMRVQGRTPDQWLQTWHSDPAPVLFNRVVAAVVPAASASDPMTCQIDRVEVKVFADGDPTPRVSHAFRSADPPWDLSLPLSMSELAGSGARQPSLALEFFSVYRDGPPGVAQRRPLLLRDREVTINALRESPTRRYTLALSDGTHFGGLTRADVEERIRALRLQGAPWDLYTQEVEAPAVATPQTPTTQPAATGAEITVMTDLLQEALTSGQLLRAVVTLWPAIDGAPQSTFSIDPRHAGQFTWRSTQGAVPPFRYKITYIFAAGSARTLEGTETGELLLLDLPRVG